MINTILSDSEQIFPGDVVAIWVWGVLQHWGILTHSGTVISNSARHGGVVEQSFDEFSEGKAVSRIGYLGRLSAWEVERRARSQIGQPYALFVQNCEHFAYWAHGEEKQSPQVFRSAAIASGVFLCFLAARHAR